MREIDPTKNMAQLILEYPQLARILWQQGIECAECMASQVDTLQDVARMYKLDLNLLIKQVHLLDATAGKSISPG
jgi:hybrid cluster-associated redox disulfide protein